MTKASQTIKQSLQVIEPIEDEGESNVKIGRPPSFFRRFIRNRNCVIGSLLVGFFFLVAIFADFLMPYSPIVINTSQNLLPPDLSHLFGTDILGRDIFSRIVFGARLSVYIALSTTIIALIIAVPLGLASGYIGGKFDNLIIGATDVLLAFPSILLALVLVAILGVGLNNLVIAIGIYSVPIFLRLIRGATLSVKEQEYVQAGYATGENGFNIVFRYILPNIAPVIIVQSTIRMGMALLTAAALGFLGLGVQAPLPEWGVMIADARNYIFLNPMYIMYPGISILLFTLGFNLLGDGLNDLLNPRLRAV